MKGFVKPLFLAFALFLSFVVQANAQSTVAGTVKDQNGDVVAGASVTARGAKTGVSRTTVTNRSGDFSLGSVPSGDYKLSVVAKGFAVSEQTVSVSASGASGLAITLEVGASRVTVTAEVGQQENAANVPVAINVISSEAILERATSVLAQAGEEEAGLNYQRTSPTIGAIVIRGLTGKNVVNFVDGVRYTNGAQRGGINTFFNLNEPTNLKSIEVLRGPSGAQYGSDSLAGTVNLVTKSPVYGSSTPEWHGEFTPVFSSADRGFGSSGMLSYGTRRFGGYISLAGRRIGDVRTAGGNDTHSAVLRFLGLPSKTLYDNSPGTGFNQYGGAVRMNFTPRDDQQIIFHYQRSQQDKGKRFDQLLGGDGNLIADLRNLMLDFGYLRYIKQGFGPFDSVSVTASYNSQREERVNQGGQGNPNGDITHQYERTSTYGLNFFVDKTFGRNTLLIGGDIYEESFKSPAYIFSPTTNLFTFSRPRIPNKATFDSQGIFVQDQWEVVPDRFRVTGALRYSGVRYHVNGSESPVVAGRRLWNDDDLKTADVSGRIGAVVRASDHFRVAFNVARGFRYPNMTDLGTLGLTGDGFEVDPATAIRLGGTIGNSAGSAAVSTGLPVAIQRSEKSNSYDLSFRYQHKRFDTELTFFRLDVIDAVTKQALILPLGAVGQFLGSDQITSQLSNGTVFVAASSAPVLIRANFSDAKIWGVEYEAEARLRRDLVLKGNYTYIKASDKASGLPPNIEGGTPPPTAFVSLRYNHSRFWVEGYSTLADRQDRLSSLDLGDRRTGAPRSRAQIQNYFRRGACVNGLTTPGTTGCTSAGGILRATNETQLQVQNRLLPIGATINGVLVVNDNTVVPLYTYLPGYVTANVRGGISINDKAGFFWAVENIFDRQYRNPSWGIDGTGRSFNAQFRYRF